MNGMAVLWANTTIINATHSIELYPLFKGMQNDTIILTIYSLKP
ncbi:MAG: hypothetical protein ACP5L4_02375 [Thermoplasmata archaeon]